MNAPLISEILCLPLATGGQALVEMHLKQRILLGDSVPYSRKRRVKHTFFVRGEDCVVKFEVFARASVLPARVSVAKLREIAQREIARLKHLAAEELVETDPRYEKLLEEVAKRIAARFVRDGVMVEPHEQHFGGPERPA